MVYVNSTTDAYSQGASISDAQIFTIVTTALASGALGAPQSNALYFVLTVEPSACARGCGGGHVDGGVTCVCV
jgi:hypothetical protein